MMIIWFVILVVLFYLLFKGDYQFVSNKKNPIEHLDQRLAKGEISLEDYNRIKTTLKER